jgi:rhamnosyltransferase
MVGVILAIHNGALFLESQLFSLLNQENVEIHIFAYDDNSSDGSSLILKRIQEEHSTRLTVLPPSDEIGGSAAKSFFGVLKDLPTSTVEAHHYWAYSDQDDYWLSTKLHNAIELLGSRNASGYSSNLYYFAEDGSRAGVLKKKSKFCKYDHLFQAASAGCTYVLTAEAALSVHSTILDCYARLPEGASHDWLTYTICRSSGLPWVHDPRSFVMYRQHTTNSQGYPRLSLRTLAKVKQSKWYRANIWFALSLSNELEPDNQFVQALLKGGTSKNFAVIKNWNHLRRESSKSALLFLMILVGIV